MARYKVGDKVRLIDNFVQYEEYHMRDRNNNPGYTITVKWSLEERMKLVGKIVTISQVGDYYRIKEDNYRKHWTDDMFVGAAKCFVCRSLL